MAATRFAALLATAVAVSFAAPVAGGNAAVPDPGHTHAGSEGHAAAHGHDVAGEPPAADDPHAAHRAALAARDERPVGRPVEGLSIPDVEVTDHNGERRRFYTDLVAGKTVAVNFVFTTCTTICPPMGATFGRLQQALGDRVGRDVHLVSVSVDPVTDTPERLRAWGATFGAGDGWTLVTGDRPEIVELLKALEVFTPDITEHSPIVLLGSEPRGEWTRAYGLAPPAKLAEILTELAPHPDAGAAGEGAR